MHGVWCYDRVCKVAAFMVYKQIVYVFTLFFYNFDNLMSGTLLYDTPMQLMYSAIYTFVPVLVVGSLHQPVRAETMLKYPQAYIHGQCNQGQLVLRPALSQPMRADNLLSNSTFSLCVTQGSRCASYMCGLLRHSSTHR